MDDKEQKKEYSVDEILTEYRAENAPDMEREGPSADESCSSHRETEDKDSVSSVENTLSNEEQETEEQKETIEDTIYDWGRSLVAAVVGVVLIFTFLVRLIGVSGPSMQDTLYTGDRLLVLNSIFCDFKQGDVVVVDAYNAQLNDTIVKRIVATGGQTVNIDFFTGTVYVDGVALEEPYIKEPTYTAEGLAFPITLKENEVFVMGDNRNRSTDSRSDTLGPIDEQYIQGKAVFLLLPGKTPGIEKREFNRIGFVK